MDQPHARASHRRDASTAGHHAIRAHSRQRAAGDRAGAEADRAAAARGQPAGKPLSIPQQRAHYIRGKGGSGLIVKTMMFLGRPNLFYKVKHLFDKYLIIFILNT